MSKETTLYIARHGETSWNVERRMQGHKGVGLSKTGYSQAEELAKQILKGRYPISVIYSSHLERAVQTADVIAGALGLPVKIHPGLSERKFGEFEGRKVEELEKLQVEGQPWWEITPPGGESPEEFRDRSISAMREIMEENKGAHVSVVSHGGTIRMLKEYFNQKNGNNGDVGFDIQNASLWIHKVE